MGTISTVSGGYWYHRQQQAPAPEARDPAFQDQLMDRLAALAPSPRSMIYWTRPRGPGALVPGTG
jgi:hypothetical protein